MLTTQKQRPARTFTWKVTRKNGCLSTPFIAQMEHDTFQQVCAWTQELLRMPTGAPRTLRVLELKTLIDLIIAFPGTTIDDLPLPASASSAAIAA